MLVEPFRANLNPQPLSKVSVLLDALVILNRSPLITMTLPRNG